MVPDAKPSISLVWVGLAPPRVEVFCWLVVSGKVVIANVLRRRGISLEEILDMCPLCGKDREVIDHLFLYCEFSYHVWCRFLANCVVSWCFLGSLADLFEAWRLSPFSGSGVVLWRILPFASYGWCGKKEMIEFSGKCPLQWRM